MKSFRVTGRRAGVPDRTVTINAYNLAAAAMPATYKELEGYRTVRVEEADEPDVTRLMEALSDIAEALALVAVKDRITIADLESCNALVREARALVGGKAKPRVDYRALAIELRGALHSTGAAYYDLLARANALLGEAKRPE